MEIRSEYELTLEQVKGKLLDEASRRNNSKHSIQEFVDNALHILRSQDKEIKEKSNSTSTLVFCNKVGNIKRDRLKYKKRKEENLKQKVSQVTHNDVCLHVRKFYPDDGDDWCIDSDAISHISSNREFLKTP